MCSVCLEQHPAFCRECQIEIGIGGSYKNSKREVLFMTLAGLILGALYVGFLYIEYPETPFDYPQNWYVLLAFAIGVSLVGSYYILKDWSFYREARNIPFIGLKAAIFIPIITAATFIPFIYYLYHFFWLLWQAVTGKRADA